MRDDCVRGRGGRSIAVHPQEALLQEARALQASPDFAQYRRERQVAEHRLARLVQLGIRQARYFGRTKTRFQLLMAAAVANLTLLAAFAQQNTASTALSAALLAVLVASWALAAPQPRPKAALPRRSAHPASQHAAYSSPPFPLTSHARIAPSRPDF